VVINPKFAGSDVKAIVFQTVIGEQDVLCGK